MKNRACRLLVYLRDDRSRRAGETIAEASFVSSLQRNAADSRSTVAPFWVRRPTRAAGDLFTALCVSSSENYFSPRPVNARPVKIAGPG